MKTQRGMAAIREGENDGMGVSLKDLSKKLEDFAKARDWEKYHTPRNLLLAMVLPPFLLYSYKHLINEIIEL